MSGFVNDPALLEKVNIVYLNGFSEKQIGSVDEIGHYVHVILDGVNYISWASISGSVQVVSYDSEEQFQAVWDSVEKMYADFYGDDDENV